MVEHASVVRIDTYLPAAGRRDDLIEAVSGTVQAARQAEGNFGSQVCSVGDQPDAVAVVSRWRDGSDLRRYLDRHAAEFEEATAGLVSGPPHTVELTSLRP